jgi:hypothetical protein
MLDGRRCRIWLSSPRESMLCTGARIPECARPMTRCRSLSDCGGTPVLAGGCRHFNSFQGGVAPDQALAARDSWRGDLLQGPVVQGQPFHSSARTPRPGAPTETSCQVPLWRLPFACQAGDTSPTVIVCLHRLRPAADRASASEPMATGAGAMGRPARSARPRVDPVPRLGFGLAVVGDVGDGGDRRLGPGLGVGEAELLAVLRRSPALGTGQGVLLDRGLRQPHHPVAADPPHQPDRSSDSSYRSGTSHHGAPVLVRHRMPSINCRRVRTGGRPGLSPSGSKGSGRAHWSLVTTSHGR